MQLLALVVLAAVAVASPVEEVVQLEAMMPIAPVESAPEYQADALLHGGVGIDMKSLVGLESAVGVKSASTSSSAASSSSSSSSSAFKSSAVSSSSAASSSSGFGAESVENTNLKLGSQIVDNIPLVRRVPKSFSVFGAPSYAREHQLTSERLGMEHFFDRPFLVADHPHGSTEIRMFLLKNGMTSLYKDPEAFFLREMLLSGPNKVGITLSGMHLLDVPELSYPLRMTLPQGYNMHSLFRMSQDMTIYPVLFMANVEDFRVGALDKLIELGEFQFDDNEVKIVHALTTTTRSFVEEPVYVRSLAVPSSVQYKSYPVSEPAYFPAFRKSEYYPETFRRSYYPETFRRTYYPESFRRTYYPETFRRAYYPETFRRTFYPEAYRRTLYSEPAFTSVPNVLIPEVLEDEVSREKVSAVNPEAVSVHHPEAVPVHRETRRIGLSV